jgi:catechol 2,3-dioxygenase-like lactoylglutathione lyase family enzyme
MYDHVGIRVSDREASERFYRAVLEAIDLALTHDGGAFTEWDDFVIGQASAEKPVTRHLHVGFVSPSREQVDEFWRVGTEAGYKSDGEPGPRTEYGDDYYGSFLLDPDGNSVEAVHHGDLRRGNVDHLWIGVADLDAAASFYGAIAPFVGLREGTTSHERRQFRGAWATFSLLADGRAPTENPHTAFPVPDRKDVHRFYEAAIAAGCRDNGSPREWPEYHPGYYGAFVLDPDGNNVEAVHHGVRAENVPP